MRCFISHDRQSLRYLAYVRSLLEYDSHLVALSKPYIERNEQVLDAYTTYTFLNLPSLELRHLRYDLLWCYKIVFGLTALEFDVFFQWNPANVLMCGTSCPKQLSSSFVCGIDCMI